MANRLQRSVSSPEASCAQNSSGVYSSTVDLRPKRFWGSLARWRSSSRSRSKRFFSDTTDSRTGYCLDSSIMASSVDVVDSRVGDNKATIEFRLRLSRKAEELLTKAETADVAFVMRACMNYEGSLDEDCPIQSRALSISVNDFLQIKEKFNEDWWIGRITKEGGEDGFVPSPKKLERKHYQQEARSALRNRTRSTGAGRELRTRDASDCSPVVSRRRATSDENESYASGLIPESSGTFPRTSNALVVSPVAHGRRRSLPQLFKKPEAETVKTYDIVPHMRPILLVGPSLKEFDVTDLMQEPVIDCLKRRFKDRPGLGAKVSSQSILADIRSSSQAVYDEAKTMDLLLLDTNVSYPTDFMKAGLAPLVIYIRINSVKVLKRLIRTRGKLQAKRLGDQLAAAEKLAQMHPGTFDLILDETQLDEACDKLVAFLELHYRATRPKLPRISTSRQLKYCYRSRSEHQLLGQRKSLLELRQYTYAEPSTTRTCNHGSCLSGDLPEEDTTVEGVFSASRSGALAGPCHFSSKTNQDEAVHYLRTFSDV